MNGTGSIKTRPILFYQKLSTGALGNVTLGQYRDTDDAIRSSVSSPNAIDTLAPPTSINIATTQHALSKDAGSKIYNHVIFPIALRKNLREFHPFVNSIPERIARGEIVCLRDLENTLLWLAPV